MPANEPYDPRYNAKLYVPKLTEEERLARATPLENLRSLRFRSEVPAAPVEAPVPAESVTQAPEPQDSAAPQDAPAPAPAPDYRPTALEVVFAEFPEIFTQDENRENIEHDDEHRAGHRADGQAWEHAHHPEANVATTSDPPSALAYEEDDILAYANVVSFYSRPRRNATLPKAARQRSGGPRFATSLIPHHSSG